MPHINETIMKIKSALIVAFLISVSASAYSQNVTDSNGLRQGEWSDRYDNGNLRYKGQFKDGKGVGVFEYYDENGRLKAKNIFDGKSNRVYNQMFAANGKVVAEGWFDDQKRDGEWKFYSEKDGSLILVEPYSNGKINGVSKGYKNKQVVEEIEYVNGVKNGKFNTYYDNGRPLSVGRYKDGLLSGMFTTYYPNGAVQYKGEYSYGVRMGIWVTYDEQGNEISSDRHDIINYNDPTLEDLLPDE